MRYIFILLFILVMGCQGSHQKSYSDLESAFIEWYFKFHPIDASRLGIQKYNDHLTRYDINSRDEYLADVRRFLIELLQIDHIQLDVDQQSNYIILENYLNSEIYKYTKDQYLHWRIDLFAKWMHNSVWYLVDFEHVSMLERVNAVIKRLTNMGNLIGDAHENILYYSEYYSLKALDYLDSLEKLLIQVPLKLTADHKSMDDIENLIATTQGDILEFRHWIKNDLSKMDNILNGKNKFFFDEQFKINIGSHYSIQRIYDLAVKKTISIQNDMFKSALKVYLLENDEPIWVDRDDSLFVIKWVLDKKITNDENDDNQLSSLYASIQRIRSFIKSNHEIPQVNGPSLEIKYSESYIMHEEKTYLWGYQPFFDNDAIYYSLKPSISNDNAYWGLIPQNQIKMDYKLMGDLYPGDITVSQYSPEKNNPMRSMFIDPVTHSGWKCFMRNELVEMGYGNNDTLAHQLMNQWLNLQDAVYAYAELDLNKNKKELNTVSKYIEHNLFLDPSLSNSSIQFILNHPFVSLQSFVGFIELNRLKNDYKRKMDDAFNKHVFYELILEQGIIPISRLREVLL